MAGESEPLLLDTVFREDGFARIGGLLVGVARLQQRDHGFLTLEVDGVPLGLLSREFAADVEGTGNVHGHVVEVRGEVENDKVVRLDLAAVVKVVPGIDMFSGAHDGGIRPAGGPAITENESGLGFDLILVHSRASVSNSLLDALGAERAVATEHGDLLRRFYVSHFVDESSGVTLVGGGVTFG